MATVDLDSPDLFLNRDLSWLEFNDRVLREGLSPDVPPLERLKFLAIAGSNLDEFFMIRVAGLRRQQAAGLAVRDPSGLTPEEQLSAVAARAARMVKEQYQGIGEVLGQLAKQGVCLLSYAQTSEDQKQFIRSVFSAEVLPSLTPLAMEELDPRPLLPGLQLNLALLVSGKEGDAAPSAAAGPAADDREKPRSRAGETPATPSPQPARVVVVPVPKGLPRFLTLPAEKGLQMICLEEVIAQEAGALVPGQAILACTVFRLTRDADVDVQEEEAEELIQAMEQALRERRRRDVVRLEISARAGRAAGAAASAGLSGVASAKADGAVERLRAWLMDFCQVKAAEVFEVEGPLDASALMDIATRPGFDRLKDPPWPPQPPRDLLGAEDLWQALRERDALLLHPYESFDPVVRLVEQAADDPNVLAIKQTLYRTSGESPIVRALARAAEKGKQVTVLVELRARFDEAKNVSWARSLEDAGCYVLYGIAGFKTHAKVLLIVRREAHRICRYVHLSTGNYNDRTARLYSDVGLLTSDGDMASDAAAFFNLLTGSSQPVGWKKFVIAPTSLRDRLVALIAREVQTSTPETPGLILAKLNSLQDKEICQALYYASQAGVRIRLNVRGICCLRPGVKGVSDHIEVVSIVDRYLEHARAFYFRNGGHDELYVSSADWMTRNLDHRLELLFPVAQKDLKARLLSVLNVYFADNVKARRLAKDGSYKPVSSRGAAVRAQERLYHDAVEAARARQPVQEFRPLTRPAE